MNKNVYKVVVAPFIKIAFILMVVIAENFVYDCYRSTGKLKNKSEKNTTSQLLLEIT